MYLLEITASNRVAGSLSRSLSGVFITEWCKQHLNPIVSYRDVGSAPPPHPTALVSLANYTPPEKRTAAMIAALAESDALIDEFLAADRIVIASPMYIFSVPSTLKAYLDNIVRVGRTFSLDTETFQFAGLATGKRALVITTSAAEYPVSSPMAALDFHAPYLRTILGFMGVSDVTAVSAPNQFAADTVRSHAAAKAQAELMQIAANW